MGENPKQCHEVQDVQIWDFQTETWVKGFRTDIKKLPDVYVLKWTDCQTTNKAPDGIDVEIDVEKASSISVQADSTAVLSDGSSIDVNVHSSPDGSSWDTTPYAEFNIGDAEVKTVLVEPGPKKIRLRLDYNSGGSRADVTVKVKVRE